MAADAASTAGTSSEAVPCPDPSVHEKQHKLSEQASTAALYVTHPERQAARESPLDTDGRLSSKSAATSLKYARAQDLPSYPSHGVNIAHSAGAAAAQAKDYKMKELWQPEMSSAGSRAALLAHQKGSDLDLWKPSASEAGNSAAVLAMRNQKSVELDRGYTEDGRNRALLAATKSHHDDRRRAGTTPATVHPAYPDSHNSGKNALSAATASHGGPTRGAKIDSDRLESDAMQAARIQNLGDRMDRQLFTEHPDVEIEKQERAHNAALRASAVSMAKEMYEQANRPPPASPDLTGAAGAGAAHSRAPASGEKDIKQEAIRYIHLQEAAHKLAAERLAKVEKDLEYRRNMEYYGYEVGPRKSRLSIRGRRARASSDAEDKELEKSDSDSEVDQKRARRIRAQMSGLNKAMEDSETKKQQEDRANLLAAAQKRVRNQMHSMDEKVFADTGKVSDAMLEEWEAKARKRAEEQRVEQAKHQGKTHVGGGKFMDQSEIEAIALARLRPTLNDIDKTAAERRQRDEDLRVEKEQQARDKDAEKAKHRLEKAAAKQEKDAEKARKKDEKAKAKEEKKLNKEAKKDAEKATATAAATGAAASGTAAVATAEPAEDAATKPDEPEAKPEAGSEPPRPALARLHTGDYTDALPTDDEPRRKPDLERHISTIDSSGSDDEDEEEEEEGHPETVPEEDDDGDFARPSTTESFPSKPELIRKSIGSDPEQESPKKSRLGGLFASRTKPEEKEKEKKQDEKPSVPAVVEPESPKKSRRFSSLLGRKSRSEREPGKISASKHKAIDDSTAKPTATAASGAGAATTAAAVGGGSSAEDHATESRPSEPTSEAKAQADTTQHMGTDGQIGDATKVSGIDGPEASSPTSFHKRDGSLSGESSLYSSSGLEEEDIQPGRTGRIARAMGLGKLRKKMGKDKEGADTASNDGDKAVEKPAVPATAAATESTGAAVDDDLEKTNTRASETEHFEEARDRFDEHAAPQPAFAGQAKTESPARETKFHEEM